MSLYRKKKKTFYLIKVKSSEMFFQEKGLKGFLLAVFKLFSITLYTLLLLSYLAPFFHPDTIVFLPFIGLAYPIIIFSTLLTLILWYFISPKWSFITLLIILMGGNLHLRYFSFTLLEGEMKNNTLKIMSYNVRLFDLYNSNFESAKKTRNGIFELIREENPDVLCLQEYFRQDDSNRFITKDSLISIMKSSYFYEKCSYNPHGKQHYGIVTFSKYPIINNGFVEITNPNERSYNYCIYTDIVKGLDTFRIYNAHLQSIKLYDNNYEIKKEKMYSNEKMKYGYKKLNFAFSKRADQAKEIMNHANNSRYPTVICGDFNDTPLSYTYNTFRRKLIDAFTNTSFGVGSTYLGSLPAGRIDYIFHTKDLSSNNFQIIDKPLSDHCAISCIISI